MTVPFNEPNNRIFWACQGVFVEERNTEAGNNGNPTGATFLNGVQAVGVSSDNPAISMVDVGRFQRKYIRYQQQTIEITISRVLDRNSETFYKVVEGQYTDYQNSHILHANNFGSKGAKDNNQKTLRNYDITILYTPDRFEQINAGNASSTDPDKNNVISVSYLNCLITNISYSIGVDGVEESVTLTTKNIKYNDDYTTLSDYNLPGEWSEAETYKTRDPLNPSERPPSVDTAFSPTRYKPQSGQTLRRHHFDLTKTGYGQSKLPEEIKQLFNFDTPEMLTEGTEELQILGIQSINIDVSFDYTNLMDVGNWRGSEDTKEHEQNRWQVLNLPVSINCTFTGTLRQALPYYNYLYNGENRVRNVDNVYTKSEADGASKEWQEADREIKIVASGIDKYFVWDLGKKNYLTSIEYTGGDAGGGNVEATLTYTNQYSDFVITRTENVLDLTNTGPY